MGLIKGVMCVLLVLCLAEQAEQRELGPGGENEDFGPQGQPEVNVTKLLETMEAMKDRIIKLEAMEDEIIELKYKLNKVESEVAEQVNITREIDENLNNHVSVLRGMSTQSMILATQSKQTAAQSLAKATQSIKRLSNLENKVAFSTYLSTSIQPTSSNSVIVPFDGIFTNVGGHFSGRTHKFTCPVNGYYYFSYSVFSGAIIEGRDDGTRAQLVKDGTLINRAYCGTDTEEYIQCQPGNSAVIYCGRDSNVYVQTYGSNTKIYGSSLRYTTFSGFLIN